MPALLRVRELTIEERTKIAHLAHAHRAAARLVQRARIIWLSHRGDRVPESAAEVDLSAYSARLWIKRCNDRGLPGLDDEPRSGRPATDSSEQVSLVIATALTNPDTVGRPFAWWPRDRLEAYLNEETGVAMKRSRSDELLIRAGWRGRMQETWFSERVAPDFAHKRGPSSRSPPSRLRGVSEGASLSWGRRVPRPSQGPTSSRRPAMIGADACHRRLLMADVTRATSLVPSCRTMAGYSPKPIRIARRRTGPRSCCGGRRGSRLSSSGYSQSLTT